MAVSLAGQSAIITGASRGIGRASAAALAAVGVRVGLLARNEAPLLALAAEIQAAGGDALPVVCDVADAAQISSAVTACHNAFGKIDMLVNNAGVFLESEVADMRLEDWNRVMCVNATAPYLLCREVLNLMKTRGAGRIINISSTSGIQGYVYQAAYCASKHALIGFSRCLALEAKPLGIHVNVLCPGGVRTDFINGTFLAERLRGQAMLEPENVAESVVYLAQQPDNVDIADIVIRRCHRG